MNRKLSLILVFILILAFFTGCRTGGRPSAPKPDAGKATVKGKVFSTSENKPYPKAPVWLAEVYRQGEEGAYVLDHAFSPAAFADDKGFFVISNVEPKEYVIVVGDPDGLYVVIPDDAGRARVWKTEADKILDVGTINVSLSPSVQPAVKPSPQEVYPAPKKSTPVNPYP